jgi:hypothetical protein
VGILSFAISSISSFNDRKYNRLVIASIAVLLGLLLIAPSLLNVTTAVSAGSIYRVVSHGPNAPISSIYSAGYNMTATPAACTE